MQSVKEIRVPIDTEWTRQVNELIQEINRCPSAEKITELATLIEAHSGCRFPVEKLFAERQYAADRLRKGDVI